jgi:hypothetical protein
MEGVETVAEAVATDPFCDRRVTLAQALSSGAAAGRIAPMFADAVEVRAGGR